MHYVISRCKEKGAAYSMAVHQHILDKAGIDFSQVAHMQVWSDGGRHFRSACGISTVATRSLEYICRLGGKKDLPSCQTNFGLASHFKNQCDGQQAALRKALESAAQSETISDIATMIDRCRRLYAEGASRSEHMPAYFWDF